MPPKVTGKRKRTETNTDPPNAPSNAGPSPAKRRTVRLRLNPPRGGAATNEQAGNGNEPVPTGANAAREPSPPVEVPLTMGVEIELLTEFREILTNTVHHDMHVERIIEDQLRRRRLILNRMEWEDDYLDWQVTQDGSVLEDRPPAQGHIWTSIELVSRIFDDVGLARREMRAALAAVNDIVLGTAVVNETTGFHVHVGFPQYEDGPPLRTLRNMGLVVTGFEHLINRLVPAHRLWQDGEAHIYCRAPSQLPGLAQRTGFGRGRPVRLVWDRIRRIRAEATDLTRFGALFQGPGNDRRTAYNFVPIIDPEDQRNTVEFRQFPSSLDLDTLWRYLRFAVCLVRWCHDATDDQVTGLLRHIRNRLFTTELFLEVISGGPALAQAFQPHLYNHQALRHAFPMPWESAPDRRRR